MSITTEQLRALHDALKSWQYGYDPQDDKDQFDMLATAEWAVIELLANREALPVATVLFSPHGVNVSTIDVALPDGTKLYTAPPAPAVPDAIITAPIEAMRCGPAASYVLGWNACRAAMLEAAPEGGNENN